MLMAYFSLVSRTIKLKREIHEDFYVEQRLHLEHYPDT